MGALEAVGESLLLVLACVGVLRLAIVRYVPGLVALSESIGVKDDVFGAIFVAMGNAFPVLIITTFSATDKASYRTGPAVVVGSTLWNVCVTAPLVAILSPTPIVLSAFSTIRECMAQVVVAGWLMVIFLVDGHIGVELSLVLALIYAAYVAVLWFLRDWDKPQPKSHVEDKNEEDEEEERLLDDEGNKGHGEEETSWVDVIVRVVSLPYDAVHTFVVPDPASRPAACVLTCVLFLGIYNYLVVLTVGLLESELSVDRSFLALFFVGPATDMPDMLSNAVLARSGHGTMGFGAAMGANVCCATLGLAIPWFVAAALGTHVTIDHDGLVAALCVWGGLSFLLIFAMALSGWVYHRAIGLGLTAAFVAYLVSQTILLAMGKVWVQEEEGGTL